MDNKAEYTLKTPDQNGRLETTDFFLTKKEKPLSKQVLCQKAALFSTNLLKSVFLPMNCPLSAI